jgi:uncharacterized spore protein YtfJ
MAVRTPEHGELASELLERIGQTVGQRAQASTIFGEAVEREGVTVIPVAKARFGFGGGGGGGSLGEEGQGSGGGGGGGGGGVAVSPIGYIELRDHGSEFIRIRTPIDFVALVAAAALAAISVKRLLG